MKINLPVTDTDSAVPKAGQKDIITNTKEDSLCISRVTKEELTGASHNNVGHQDMQPETFADLWKSMKAGRLWSGQSRGSVAISRMPSSKPNEGSIGNQPFTAGDTVQSLKGGTPDSENPYLDTKVK